METFFSDFPIGMSVEEVTKEANKLGFSLEYYSDESESYYFHGENSNGYIMIFSINSEFGMYRKHLDSPEIPEDNTDISTLLEKHRGYYLSNVGIFFDYEDASKIENAGAIFFFNQEYMGQIQINYNNGKTQVQYGLLKLGIGPLNM